MILTYECIFGRFVYPFELPSRVIWINHVIHTKTETQYHDDTWRFLTPAGQMISESVGRDRVFIVGLAYGKGRYWRNWQKGPDSRSVDVVPEPKGGGDGIEPVLGAVRKSNYFLRWDQITSIVTWIFSDHHRIRQAFILGRLVFRVCPHAGLIFNNNM